MPRARLFFLIACLITLNGFSANAQQNTLNSNVTASSNVPSTTTAINAQAAASTPTTASTNPPSQIPRLKSPVVQSLEQHAPFRVGVCPMPPFAFPSGGGHWSGLSVTLFENMAKCSGLRYSYVEFNTMLDLINAVENHTIDFAAIAIDPTPEFELTMNFTNAFEQSGTRVAIAKHIHTPLLYLAQSIWQSTIPRFVVLVLFILCIFGVSVGLIERKRNTGQFGGSFWSTVGEGVWWSSATISTVGYGDRVPVTKRGRFIGGLWMLIAFALTSILAGLLSSVLTVARLNAQIHTDADLFHVQCGAILASAAYEDGINLKFNMKSYLTLDDALQALNDGHIGAVLGESVRLDWLTKQKKWDNLITLPQTLVTLYSVFPVSSEVDPATLDVLNYQLLKCTDSPEWGNMRQLFLGDQS